MDLDPNLPPDDELLESLRDLEISSNAKAFAGEACERYTRALEAGAGDGRRPRARSGLRAAPRAGRPIRRPLRAAQGGTGGTRLRGPPAEGGRAAHRLGPPAGPLPGAVRPPDGRRVPGHQRPTAAADRAAPGSRDPPLPGRRRVPVDLRLPARRRRGLPPRAPPLRRGRRAQRRGAAADRELPRRASARRGDQRDRARHARRLRAADRIPGGRGEHRTCGAPPDRR